MTGEVWQDEIVQQAICGLARIQARPRREIGLIRIHHGQQMEIIHIASARRLDGVRQISRQADIAELLYRIGR